MNLIYIKLVNSNVAIAAGQGILCSKDSRLLAENGDGIVLSKAWFDKQDGICENKSM